MNGIEPPTPMSTGAGPPGLREAAHRAACIAGEVGGRLERLARLAVRDGHAGAERRVVDEVGAQAPPSRPPGPGRVPGGPTALADARGVIVFEALATRGCVEADHPDRRDASRGGP